MKDTIIRTVDKIFPAEVEAFFMGHSDIIEAQVRSLRNKRINLLFGTR